ncbi:MAG: hypothetical protein DME19_04985 [Verrucomicrobia bacterium]|nr:MAG: hypothetical protein DME19_04985 [Verrucomicrobiota bacterium]
MITLEAWNFQTNRVRYDLPNRPWARRAEKLLPDWVNQRIGLLQPVTTFVTPNFTGESVLSSAFSIREPTGTPGIGALRLVVSDDRGQEFDPAFHDANVHGGYWVAEMQAFPRRGRELRLRLMENNNSLGEVTIPNPARGSYPKWKPESLPVSVKTNGLEFSLVKFQSFQSGAATFTKDGVYPRTQCVFRVAENGRDSTAWRPVSFEISDATGNHWRAPFDSRLEGLNRSEVSAGFLGALWAEEAAWKLGVELRRVAEFPENELLRIDHIPIPRPDDVLQPQTAYDANGATVEVAAIIGSKVGWNRIYLLNPNRGRDCVTVLIKGRILSQGRRVTFVEARDERGNLVRLEGAPSEPGHVAGLSPDFLPYSFNFKPAAGANELTLVLGVSQSRFVEFLAKPEQVREDMTTPPN